MSVLTGQKYLISSVHIFS